MKLTKMIATLLVAWAFSAAWAHHVGAVNPSAAPFQLPVSK